jgi:hypothetical protein
MRDFAILKDEEITILESQYLMRDRAAKQAQAYEDKRAALESEASTVKNDGSASMAAGIRNEAQELDMEIKELEIRLMEMRARHRHLLDRANQLESSVAAKLSSYNSSIAIVDMEIRKFLRRPPIEQSLPSPGSGGAELGMYALKPERRTLEMAKEQWKAEQEILAQRRADVENERRALQEGRKMWQSAVQRITDFEKSLRAQTKSLSQSQLQPGDAAPAAQLLSDLSSLIESLESDVSHAESNDWNLLICCLGAELEALREGRAILEQALGIVTEDMTNSMSKPQADHVDDQDQDAPDDNLIRFGGNANDGVRYSPGASSNKSLEETLKEFGNGEPSETGGGRPGRKKTEKEGTSTREELKTAARQNQILRTVAARSGSVLGFGFGPTPDSRSDTEDDDPGPDFFISHA